MPKIKCEICGKSFKQRGLKAHMKLKHKEQSVTEEPKQESPEQSGEEVGKVGDILNVSDVELEKESFRAEEAKPVAEVEKPSLAHGINNALGRIASVGLSKSEEEKKREFFAGLANDLQIGENLTTVMSQVTKKEISPTWSLVIGALVFGGIVIMERPDLREKIAGMKRGKNENRESDTSE